MNPAEDESFLSRWSRRKAQARAGLVPPDPPAGAPVPERLSRDDPPPEAGPSAGSPPAQAPHTESPDGAAAPAARPAPAEPLPTLQDALRLTPEADFRPFVRPEVAPEVRNAALRRLFADPHFNQMDGLDIYIDDYSKPDPLPAALAQRMVAAQFMRLFDAPQEAASHPPAQPAVDRALDGNSAPAPAPVPATGASDQPIAPAAVVPAPPARAAPTGAPPIEPAQ